MNSSSKLLLGIAAAVSLAIAISPFYLNYVGYCWSERNFITDEAMIHSAIGEIISINNSKRSVGQPLVYLDTDDFMRLNPECCLVHAITGDGPPFSLSFLDRILGNVHDWVVVIWRQRTINAIAQQDSVLRTNYLYFNGCGKSVN